MPNQNRNKTAGASEPKTADQLTAENVKAIAELERAAQANQSTADRVAGLITRFCGSVTFVWVHVAWFAFWITANSGLFGKPIDPFPFNFLTLVVSLEAIFLSTFILISENRQGHLDERRSHLDLQINLLAEQENTKMLELLQAIAEKVGVPAGNDPGLAVLEQKTRPEKLLEQIEESVMKDAKGTPTES